MKQKRRLHSLYLPQNTPMFTESRGEFSDLHSIFRLSAFRYFMDQGESVLCNSAERAAMPKPGDPGPREGGT